MAAESMTSREKEREQVLSLMDVARNDNGQDTESGIASLALINDIIVCHRDAFAFEQFVASLPELLHSRSSAVIPKYVVQIIGDLCLRNLDYAGQLCSYLLTSLKDDSPDVVRQAITSGTNLFCCIFQKSGQQLADKGKLDDWLEELLKWALIFKDEVYQIAFQTGLHGVKLLALKFVEITILLFTPDSGGSATPNNQGMSRTFNITYLVGDHPLLDPTLLSQEGNKNLDILLEQLHPSGISALQSSVVIVIINSLAALAKRRLPLYDRLIPVLLGLQRNCNSGKAGQTASVQHALKTALLSCLKCTNEPEASPWRDKIAVTLRAMNAGDQADQIIRQLARMLRNSERASRDPRIIKEERTVFQHPYVAGANKKRNAAHDNGTSTDINDMSAKRSRSSQILSEKQHNSVAADALIDISTNNDVSVGGIVLESELNPVQKMIAMIGALLAEGERGRESLELLISKIQSDLLADIVIANMQFLPKSPPVVLSRFFDAHQAPMSLKTPLVTQIQTQTHTSSVRSLPEESSLQPPASDVCRDPRRDPRRIDPRRMAVPVGIKANSVKVEDFSPPSIISSEKQENAPFEVAPIEVKSEMPTDKQQLEQNQTDNASLLEPISTEILTRNDENMKNSSASNETCVSSVVVSTNPETVQETPCFSPSTSRSEEIVDDDLPLEAATSSNELLTPPAEEKSFESVTMPTFVVLTDEQKTSIGIEAFTRIVEEQTQGSVEAGRKLRCAVLARLLAEHGAEIDAVRILQKRVVFDYQSNKGHELILHILYHLYAQFYSQPNELQSSSPMAFLYEKILLSVAEALRDNLPASDKSLSRLLGEAPYLPESSLKLLEGLCHPDSSSYEGTDFPTGDRVTQGLGAVWSLILTRPVTRIPCLNIALQCTIHESDEVRAKAVRLVANRLYAIEYLSHDIETFAIKMLLSVVNIDQIYESLQESTDIGSSISDENKRKVAGGQETMHEENAVTLEKSSVSDVLKPSQNTQSISVGKAQRYMSLYFALCTKNHALLHQIFNVYGQAPKATKQAIHRHIPSIIRTIGSSSSYILKIVSDPPAGSENLLLQVLHIFTDGKTPSKELISTVKQLYEAKLKDAAILIPMLSSLSKEEVLPIFPRLVDLPLDKFQNALARILQGSVHTGPALTPAEVLIAIHSIDPEKDNIPLKKITDACSACFDQKTVFTQQVLEQVLNHLVQENPLPLLFMRTVIQAIGTFPSLVDFVMRILSQLIKKQIWKLPKLWVGFLKCAYQTKPHSFHVLLQLPAPILENALNKHPTLRGPLASYASQVNIRTTVPRSTLVVLGLAQDNQPVTTASLTTVSASSEK